VLFFVPLGRDLDLVVKAPFRATGRARVLVA
jgi:hypothetical protein